MRTVLVTGTGGAGVSTLVRSLALAAVAHGARVTIATMGQAWEPAMDDVAVPGLQTIDLAQSPGWTSTDQAIADLAVRCGGDGLVGEEWRALPGMDVATGLLALPEAVLAADLSIVDLGDLRRAEEVLAAAVRLPWLLRRLLGLQPGLAATLNTAASELLPRALDSADSAADLLRSTTTRLDAVVGPDRASWPKLRARLPRLLVGGLRPGRLYVRSDAPAAQDCLPFERVAFPEPYPGWDPGAHWEPTRSSRHPSGVERSPEGLLWRLTLPWVTATEVAVQRRADDLLVSVHGRVVLVPLPAAVRRCRIAGAEVTQGELRIHLVLDDPSWTGERWTPAAAPDASASTSTDAPGEQETCDV